MGNKLVRIVRHSIGLVLFSSLFLIFLSNRAIAENFDFVISLEASEDLPYALQEAFILAKPNTLIELPEGKFQFDDEVVLNTSHITVRGKGMDKTILSFKDQPAGAQGMLVLADAFTAEELAIEDTAGDGLRIENANGIVIRRVRIEWTNGPDETNGAYGLYPVLSQNILIEQSVVRGASDAGVYVGQSRNIIVRHNVVEFNVAGIEIENSIHADVYQNTAQNNTGGVLVFDLPGLSQAGSYTRVFENTIINNNTLNFAPPGNIVGLVPSGTGVMILSTDNVDVFRNNIRGNKNSAVSIVSFVAASILNDMPIPDGFDPYPQFINIRDNYLERPFGYYSDDSDINSLVNVLHYTSFKKVSDTLIDGISIDGLENAKLCYVDNKRKFGLPSSLSNLQLENTDTILYKLLGVPGGPVITSQSSHQCLNPEFDGVTLEAFPPVPPPSGDEPTEEEIAALCGAPGEGVNFGASEVNCPELSSYRLFLDSSDPTTGSNGGFQYDLTTPLFSDYTNKYRFIFTPDGAPLEYTEGVFEFPLGSIISKTFASSSDLANPEANVKIIETRLLIKREAGWEGVSYIWEEDMSEASLALGGGTVFLEFTDLEGELISTNYRVPNANQCGSCHNNNDALLPIGPKARLLNKTYSYSSQDINQLDAMIADGVLAGLTDSSAAPRTPVWDNPADGTLEERAKAYLDTNCAHCHKPGGRAFSTGLFLNVEQPVDQAYGVCKSPVAAGLGSGGLLYDIVPGDAEGSILSFRLESTDPAIRMPELGRTVVHKEGNVLVNAWIDSLSGSCEIENLAN